MRRVYNIKCKVVEASGLSGLLIRGQPVEGFLIVDASSESDFDVFIGKKFEIKGSLTKAPFIDSIPNDLRSFNGVFNYTPVSRNCVFEVEKCGVNVVATMDMSEDSKKMKITAIVKRKWSGDIVVKGEGDSQNEIETRTSRVK